MDASPYTTSFLNNIEMVSKLYNIKYSKTAFCAYQKLGDVFWSASFICGFFLVDGQLKITVSNRLKPSESDIIQFSIIDPSKKHRITDAMRVNASFAAESLQIGSKIYYFPCDDPADFSNKAEGYARNIFDDLLEKRTAFLSSIMSDGGLLSYLISCWETFPLEAGMAYLCMHDYNNAKLCFEFAEKKHCFWTKSIGRPGRYLHHIFIDYCKAMQADIDWTDRLVVNGLSTT